MLQQQATPFPSPCRRGWPIATGSARRCRVCAPPPSCLINVSYTLGVPPARIGRKARHGSSEQSPQPRLAPSGLVHRQKRPRRHRPRPGSGSPSARALSRRSFIAHRHPLGPGHGFDHCRWQGFLAGGFASTAAASHCTNPAERRRRRNHSLPSQLFRSVSPYPATPA